MFDRCPPFLLKAELERLAPSVALLLGRTVGGVRDSIRRWAVPPNGYGQLKGRSLERDLAQIGGRPIEMISVNHPSAQNQEYVDRSLTQLAASLEKHPAGSPPLAE